MDTVATRWVREGKRLVVRHDMLLALLLAASVIGAGTWLGWYNNKIIPAYANAHFHYLSSNPLSFLSNWDGPDYIAIAQHGYTALMSTSLFPLYPLLVRALYYVVRSYLISALLISWVSFTGAIYFYAKILKQLGLVKAGSSSISALAPFVLFPTAIFFIATYTESLFAFFALASIYYALNRHYVLAGILLLLATMTHVTGLFLVVLDAMILWEEKVPIKRIAITILTGMVGLAIFMTYLYIRYHDALAFVKAQKQGHGWLGADYLRLITSTDVFNILFCILLIAAGVYYWNKRRSLAVYALLFLLIPILGAQWGGFNRYVLMAFPIPLMLYEALKDKRQLYTFILIVSSILWTYTLLQYAAGYIGS
jgi:hypothetical protein